MLVVNQILIIPCFSHYQSIFRTFIWSTISLFKWLLNYLKIQSPRTCPLVSSIIYLFLIYLSMFYHNSEFKIKSGSNHCHFDFISGWWRFFIRLQRWVLSEKINVSERINALEEVLLQKRPKLLKPSVWRRFF